MTASNKEKFMTDILSYLDNMKKMDIPNLYIDGIDKLDLSVIIKKVNLPEDAQIYAFFEKETEFKGKEGILVTDYGTAVNPLRQDLIECLDKAGIKHVSIEELKNKAYSLVGTPADLKWEDKVVAIVEARDGTILDVVRKIKPYTLD